MQAKLQQKQAHIREAEPPLTKRPGPTAGPNPATTPREPPMDMLKLTETVLARIHPGLVNTVFRRVRNLPVIKGMIDNEYEKIMDDLEKAAKPYKNVLHTHTRIPARAPKKPTWFRLLSKKKINSDERLSRQRTQWMNNPSSTLRSAHHSG